MKYKVGDRVQIKSIDWYNENKDENRQIKFENGIFTTLKSIFLGQIMTIEEITLEKQYILMEDQYKTLWTDEMIEGLVEEETKFGTASNPLEIKSNANCLTRERVDALATKIDKELPSGNQYVWELPDGYQFIDENGNVINATKIVLEKKIREEQVDNAAQEYIDSDNAVLTYSDGFCEQTDHPFVRAAFKAGVEWADNNVTQEDCSKAPKLTSQDYSNGRFGYQLPAGFEAKLTERELILTPEKPKYPKTYKECCRIIGFCSDTLKWDNPFSINRDTHPYIKHLDNLLESFCKLLVCRDAYWKIAGEEMGLGKPWEPDWLDDDTKKYVITSSKVFETFGGLGYINYILSFPTEEMRDAFYENFKELIEQCKELL